MPFLYKPGLSDTDIQGLEQRLQKKLPSDYKDFLKKRNGFYATAPDYVSLALDKVDEGSIAFDRLFGLIPDEESNDLLAFNEEFIDELSFLDNSIAIGEDGGGNPFVWIAEAGKEGLYYWDRTHLHESDDKNDFDIAERDGCGNLFFLAPDFTSFFDLILSTFINPPDFVEE
jgi:cell wall assembly regulator SMI1